MHKPSLADNSILNGTVDSFWLPLDNAAKIYPAVINSELTSVLRISVELKERVKAKPFMEAVKAIENRFPYYKVKLKPGFFWYYLDYFNQPITVKVDKEIPCRKFKRNELMYRILVYENRISVEFSHILTDGTGTFEFLKTLLFTYLEKCGCIIPENENFLHPNERPFKGEYEDAFNKYFKKTSSPIINVCNAFHLPFPLSKKPRFDVLLGIIPMDAIVKKAKSFGVSLTEYLIAVYLFSLQEVYNDLSILVKWKSNKKIRIEVPMNLRKLFPSRTMRNFSLYVMPEIDLRLGNYTFEEIVKSVYHQMQLETDKKLMNKIISRNVGSERNLIVRSVPLLFKSILLSRMYSLGTSKYSGVITNLGKINFSPEINKHIEKFVFIPPPANEILKVNCGVVGFNNKLVMSFGNITSSKKLEQKFFKFLTSQGIPVRIENY